MCVPRFNLLITDIMMPVMEGMQLLDEIKLNKTVSDVRIIGFTVGDIDFFRRSSLISFDQP